MLNFLLRYKYTFEEKVFIDFVLVSVDIFVNVECVKLRIVNVISCYFS